MISLYWIAFALGLAALILWIFVRGLAEADVLVRWDPERRIPQGKLAVAGLVGFGMAGLSSTYAGWSTGTSVLGAVVGAVVSAGYAHRIEDGERVDESAIASGDPASQP